MGGETRSSSAISRRAAVLVVGAFLMLAAAALLVFGTILADAGAALSTQVLQIPKQ